VNLGRLFVAATLAAAAACLLTACGGGSKAVVTTPQTLPVASATGSDRFLLFPNPQQESQAPALKPIDSMEYAKAYYKAIDLNDEKNTLEKWKTANGFGMGGNEVTVVFGDRRDLGYGRRMTARRNPVTGDIAFIVENYQVDPGGVYGFSALSIEAAVRQDTRWRILINAIEYSPATPGGVAFAKFFNFNPVTGAREFQVDLDGRGKKFMPGPCLTCHGGRGDGLIPDGFGNLLFPVVHNSLSQAPGDTQAHLAPLEVDRFEFSPLPGYTRPELEEKLKTMNLFILCSYPRPAGTRLGVPAGFCERRPDNGSEWQGSAAAELLIEAYGGDAPRDMFKDTFVPAGWKGDNQSLYDEVVAPSCRACHILRGTAGNAQIDFTTLDSFQSYAIFPGDYSPNGKTAGFDDRIKTHVIDRGDMPLAKFVFDNFWSSGGPERLAQFLDAQQFTVRDASKAVLQPGRPVANPGPDRLISRGPVQLSAVATKFEDTFVWTLVTRPAGPEPILTNANSAQPVFNASVDGIYTLRLVASKGSVQSAPAILTLKVEGAPTGKKIAFDDVRPILENATCGPSCHNASRGPPAPPVFFVAANGGVRGDREVFYAEVRSRINFTDIVASPLLRKPSGRHHNGGLIANFDDTQVPGDPVRSSYDLFVNWIVAGAPLDPPP